MPTLTRNPRPTYRAQFEPVSGVWFIFEDQVIIGAMFGEAFAKATVTAFNFMRSVLCHIPIRGGALN